MRDRSSCRPSRSPRREGRSAYLAEACGADRDLRAEVEELLRAHGTSLGLLDAPDGGVPTVEMPRRWRARRHGHRPLQAAGADRRGGHGRRLRRRAGPPRPPQGGAEGHQAGHGHPPGPRPLRGRAPGAGPDGPPQHRQGPRRRRHRLGPPLLRHGAGQGHPDHRLLRPGPAVDRRAAGPVRPGLPGGAARRTRRGSSTATSSPRTSWSRSSTAPPSPRSSTSASPRAPAGR